MAWMAGVFVADMIAQRRCVFHDVSNRFVLLASL
jgi:hypothetical protein